MKTSRNTYGLTTTRSDVFFCFIMIIIPPSIQRVRSQYPRGRERSPSRRVGESDRTKMAAFGNVNVRRERAKRTHNLVKKPLARQKKKKRPVRGRRTIEDVSPGLRDRRRAFRSSFSRSRFGITGTRRAYTHCETRANDELRFRLSRDDG